MENMFLKFWIQYLNENHNCYHKCNEYTEIT